VGHPRRPVDLVRRHLPQQRLKNGLLPIVVEVRSIASCSTGRADPDAELTVDLESQLVHLPGDEDLPFDVDPFARMMLLAGTDEMGYLLRKSDEIDAWEAAHPAQVNTLVPTA
jgi:3-isopropylmalate/(R)-2-methylmalate dehydratase small subunit